MTSILSSVWLENMSSYYNIVLFKGTRVFFCYFFPSVGLVGLFWDCVSKSEQVAQMSSLSVVNYKGDSATEGACVVQFTDLLSKGCGRRVKQIHIITIINLWGNQMQKRARTKLQACRCKTHTHTHKYQFQSTQ